MTFLKLVLLGVSGVFFVLAPAGAQAQTNKHYRMQVGCPFASAKDIPDSMTLDELIKLCPPSDAKPNAAQQVTNVTPDGTAKPEPANIPVPNNADKDDRRKFRAYEGRDLSGQDMKRIANTNLKTCVQTCKGEASCKAISFDKWNNYCFLKRNVSSGLRIEPKAITLVLSSLAPDIDSRATDMERFRKRRFLTQAYRTVSARSYDACLDSCDGEARCEVFTYSRDTRSCELIARPDEWFNDPNFDSGVKRQKPN